ncbi:protein of unknown function [Serratia sp. Tan611]|nr:protein of unknown function [Serratia sp. Tan611]
MLPVQMKKNVLFMAVRHFAVGLPFHHKSNKSKKTHTARAFCPYAKLTTLEDGQNVRSYKMED